MSVEGRVWVLGGNPGNFRADFVFGDFEPGARRGRGKSRRLREKKTIRCAVPSSLVVDQSFALGPFRWVGFGPALFFYAPFGAESYAN